jgi:hypothetical protein
MPTSWRVSLPLIVIVYANADQARGIAQIKSADMVRLLADLMMFFHLIHGSRMRTCNKKPLKLVRQATAGNHERGSDTPNSPGSHAKIQH